jgi:hypothetical protein
MDDTMQKVTEEFIRYNVPALVLRVHGGDKFELKQGLDDFNLIISWYGDKVDEVQTIEIKDIRIRGMIVGAMCSHAVDQGKVIFST